MKTNDGHAPPIAWVVVCLLAVALGFYLGDRQHTAVRSPNKSDRPASLTDSVLREHTVSDIAKEASKWVVTIETQPARQQELELILPGLAPSQPQLSGGTGMIIRPDGYIVTSNHVLGMGRKADVIMHNRKKFAAKIIGRDWFSDVAVIKIDGSNFPCAKFGDSNKVEPGDWAVAIGTPMRLDHTVSLGIVSAIGRTMADTRARGANMIQTDAAINPGNSGGPLMNIHGDVIGMNTSVYRRAQNISFAVPIDEVIDVANALIAQGKIARGYIGLHMGNASDHAPVPTEGNQGVFVMYVQKDGPAGQAGVVNGDIIKAINGSPVGNTADARKLLMHMGPGSRVELELLHDGNKKNVSITLGSSPTEAESLGGLR